MTQSRVPHEGALVRANEFWNCVFKMCLRIPKGLNPFGIPNSETYGLLISQSEIALAGISFAREGSCRTKIDKETHELFEKYV